MDPFHQGAGSTANAGRPARKQGSCDSDLTSSNKTRPMQRPDARYSDLRVNTWTPLYGMERSKLGSNDDLIPWVMTVSSQPPTNTVEGKSFRWPVIVTVVRPAPPEIGLRKHNVSVTASLIAQNPRAEEFEAHTNLLNGPRTVSLHLREVGDCVTGSAKFEGLAVERQGIFKIRFSLQGTINDCRVLSQGMDTEWFSCHPRLLGVTKDGRHNRRVIIPWQLPHFVATELKSPSELRSVLTLSGTPERAYAAPCEDYINQFWPEDGERVLSLLIRALDGQTRADTAKGSEHLSSQTGGSHGLKLKIKVMGDFTIVDARGRGDRLHELTGLLLWLTSAFRIPKPGQLTSARAGVQNVSGGPIESIEYRIVPNESPPVTEARGVCWHGMFEGFVLAEGFPVPDREAELGVEMPFNIMVLLGLICYPCNYRNRVVLKGDSTALIPRVEPGSNTAQWHFVQSKPDYSSISWDVIKEYCQGPSDSYNYQSLSTMRTFVGYFPKVCINLGTMESGFRNVDISGAEYDDQIKVTFGNEVSGALGTSGMGFVTAEIAGKVIIHNTANRRIRAAHNRIHDKIRNSKELPIMLYDLKARRAWLVPELCVVLHLVLAWASYQESPELILNQLVYAKPDGEGGESAYQAVRAAMGVPLPEHVRTKDHPTFGDLFMSFFLRLGQIKEGQQNGGIEEKKDLVGYEFRDIAEFQEDLRSKRTSIDSVQSAGWLQLVSSRPEMAVLFCQSLGAPIMPDPSQGPICHHWANVPEGNDYLTATITCLRYLSKRCGGEDKLKLYNGLYCTGGKTRHDQQCSGEPWPCCNPLLQVSKQEGPSPAGLSDLGAVIIGKVPAKVRKRGLEWPDTRETKRKSSPCNDMYLLDARYTSPTLHLPLDPRITTHLPVRSDIPRANFREDASNTFRDR